MRITLKALALVALFATTITSQAFASSGVLAERSLGKASAPITVIEYASFTCSHCSVFYNEVLPEIEKNYVETGKVRFIYRDFPLDGISLKASALTRCMPEDQYYPFVKLLFKNQASWIRAPKPEDTLVQYATMAGLTHDKAKSCIEDTKMLDSLIEMRKEAGEKYTVTATPTFIINDSDEKLVGARSYNEFAAAFDKILAKKK